MLRSRRKLIATDCLEMDKQAIHDHVKSFLAKKATCYNCEHIGHYAKCCKSVKQLEESDDTDDVAPSYSVNIFRMNVSGEEPDCDFKTELLINGSLDTVLADTSVKVSVCGMATAKKWNLLDKIEPSKVKIKPYKSDLIPTVCASRCAVSFGGTSIPVL